jgi:hypothetical protein
MSRKDKVMQYDSSEGSYLRYWPILLLPALALGWFLGELLVDVASSPSPASPRAVGPAALRQALWKFNPADPKGYAITSNGAGLTTGDGKAILRGDRTPTGYQLISDPIQAVKGKPLRLSWKVRAVSGKMAVSVLDGFTGVPLRTAAIADQAIELDIVPNDAQIFVLIVNDNSGIEPPVVELGPASLLVK